MLPQMSTFSPGVVCARTLQPLLFRPAPQPSLWTSPHRPPDCSTWSHAFPVLGVPCSVKFITSMSSERDVCLPKRPLICPRSWTRLLDPLWWHSSVSVLLLTVWWSFLCRSHEFYFWMFLRSFFFPNTLKFHMNTSRWDLFFVHSALCKRSPFS